MHQAYVEARSVLWCLGGWRSGKFRRHWQNLAGYYVVQRSSAWPGVQDFFSKDCWKHHPQPYQEFMDWRILEDERWDKARNRNTPSF